jgi:hypothetical protein
MLGLMTVFIHVATAYSPVALVRIDARMVQRLAFASVAFLAASYMFVRVFRA